jgi:hypothetical protein
MLLHIKNNNSLIVLRTKPIIYKKNADAYRKQQKALTPKEKAQIGKNNTAAQHKHPKSLPPEQIGQVLTIDAAAHTKTPRDSLFPPKSSNFKK